MGYVEKQTTLDASAGQDERRECPRTDVLLPVQLHHSKANRLLAWGATRNVSPGGLLVECDDCDGISTDQVVRIHIGPLAETWPERNGFFKGRVRRLENGTTLRCAVEVLDDPPLFLQAAELVGMHPRILKLKRQLLEMADYDVNVLVRGESGTGKNVVAALIHRYSHRCTFPCVRLNCPSIPDSLLESQLFGHEKGAYTDAKQGRPGLFRVADRGTLVLDEISSVPLSVQAKLLQAIEEKKFLPLGARAMVTVNVRLVATTNDNLERKIREGAFREDLFYRLNEMALFVPPLRERLTDVLILSEHFLRTYCTEFRKDYRPLTRAAAEQFLKYAWPGNVRELENTIKRGVLLGQFETTRSASHASESHHAQVAPASQEGVAPVRPVSMNEARGEAEKQALLGALAACQYNRTSAAAYLGVSYRTVLRRMKKFSIQL